MKQVDWRLHKGHSDCKTAGAMGCLWVDMDISHMKATKPLELGICIKALHLMRWLARGVYDKQAGEMETSIMTKTEALRRTTGKIREMHRHL